VREKLKEYIAKSKAPRKRVAAGLDIATTTLSLYLNGTYKGDNAKIDEAVAGFLARVEEREATAKQGPQTRFVMTRQARMCFSVLRDCHIDGDMGVIISRAGLGKTSAIRQYAHENKDVILITARVTVNIKVLLVQISDSLRVHSGGISDYLARSIIQVLKGSQRMIVVDEAQFLPPVCLEILRQIHDETGIGLVYAGMPRLYENMVGRGSERLEQIYSRVGVRTTLPPLSEEDARLLLTSTQVPVSDRVAKHVSECSAGSARRGMKLFMSACRRVIDREITVKDIEAAQRRMMV